MSETQILIKLDNADTQIRLLKKKIEELPQKNIILNCRAKRKELKGKQDELTDLHDQLQQKIDILSEEEDKVIAKISELKGLLNKSSDFRVTKVAQRDVDGQMKRQEKLAQEQENLLNKQIKSDNVLNELLSMLEQLDIKEEKASEEFKKQGLAIKVKIDEFEKIKAECVSQLDPKLLKEYEVLRDEKINGLAIMQDGHCSVCRASFLQGQLTKLSEGPNLTHCPMCHRLFVVDASL